MKKGNAMKSICKAVAGILFGLAAIAMPVQAQVAHGSPAPHHGVDQFPIEVLSGRPDSITGGDALVRVTVRKKVALDQVRIKLNGADVTAAFAANGTARTLTGLLTGLNLGENLLEVSDTKGNVKGKGRADADIVLTNYPIQGPVFSGPHEQPYACATQSFNLPAGLGSLGATTDPNCHVPTRVDYLYRTGTGSLAQFPAGATEYPVDMANTETDKPYILRLETGTVNRAIYQTMVLHDPIAQPQAPSWSNPPANWNGRLIYTFGGGCIGGWYRQGSSTGGVTDDFMLRNGYALASSSLNVFGNNCNDLTAAESMMMVKERFIEAYGRPAHTQGWGCSGGSYAQHQLGDNYPGLLDGIIPGCSFPEVGFATIQFITDAWLLDTYFNANAAAWQPEQRRLVTGFGVYNTAPNVAIGARRIDPVTRPGMLGTSCAAVPAALRYDPVTNPTGVRCTVYDHTVNVYGRDPATGFAARPLDNVGIQYGLKVLNSGAISVDLFLDLNEKVGGFDRDATIVPQRTVADPMAMRAAYQTGRLTSGGGGLASIPIIDYRAYNDEVTGGDIHVKYHSFSLRKRLEKANGRSDNHVMLHEDNRFGLYSSASPLLQHGVRMLDQWITAIKSDTREVPQIEKVVQNKPAELKEGCNTRGDATPTFIPETLTRDPGSACEQIYSSHSFPREVAGADVASDIIKCQLKPLSMSDYAVAFSAEQWARLNAIFPSGVCDWSLPGVEQQGLIGTWVYFD
jgi:hypothetical protein